MRSTFLNWIRSLSWSDANVRGALLTVLATVALIVSLKLLANLFRKLRERYYLRIEEQRTGLRLQQWEMVSASRFRRSVRYFLGFLHLLAAILLIDVYVTLVLRSFPETESLSEKYFEFVTAPIVALFQAVIAYIPDLLYIVVVSSLTFIGALVTLGSTAAVGSAVAGVVLIYTRAFQVGDWIKVGQSTGEVTQRTLLVTRMRNAANEQITVPNGEVLRDHVVNYSPAARDGQLGFTVSVTIGYEVGWRTVEKLLLEAAEATSRVSSDPPAVVLQRTFDDFGVSYLLAAKTSGPPPLGPGLAARWSDDSLRSDGDRRRSDRRGVRLRYPWAGRSLYSRSQSNASCCSSGS